MESLANVVFLKLRSWVEIGYSPNKATRTIWVSPQGIQPKTLILLPGDAAKSAPDLSKKKEIPAGYLPFSLVKAWRKLLP
jgi:hypothetical protein